MRKKLINISLLLIGIISINQSVTAQKDAMFTQYMYNTLAVNPAYAGSKNAINLVAISRHQWVGFDGAPVTQTLTLHGPIKKFNLGTGISYLRDEIGPVVTDKLNFDLAYKLKIKPMTYLSMGIMAGIEKSATSAAELTAAATNDPYLYVNNVNSMSTNIGAGIFYYSSNYYLGVSVPQLFNAASSTGEVLMPQTGPAMHFFAIGGYVHQLNEQIKLKPSFYLKSVKGAPMSIDITASAMYSDKVIAGISYRIGDAFGVHTQLNIKNLFWVGYAYEKTLSNMGNFNKGTHEIMLIRDFRLPKDNIITSPRFF